MRGLNETIAGAFLVGGLTAASWPAAMWLKKRGEKRNTVVFLMALAAVGVGVGAGGLFHVNVWEYKAYGIPAWLVFVLVVGFWFLLECKGWDDHHTRTPVLGFLVVLVISLAVGQSVVGGLEHTARQAQVTSYVHHGKG